MPKACWIRLCEDDGAMLPCYHSGKYRGRIAPTPSGHLHIGHIRTFWIAEQRCRNSAGTLVYRNEDLDRARCKPQFSEDARVDLEAMGLEWDEGPWSGGPCEPYNQSERMSFYLNAWRMLNATGRIYPCSQSRKDIASALSAPHDDDVPSGEMVYPEQLRPERSLGRDATEPGPNNWRMRITYGDDIRFDDQRTGPQSFRAGVDFGDFLVWRKDGFPSYEFAVVVDDAMMGITEVVRGEDLLLSTARQVILYDAFQVARPAFYHCELVRDEDGRRLAKRDDAATIRALLSAGATRQNLRDQYLGLDTEIV